MASGELMGTMSIQRAPQELIFDYVMRWCHGMREREILLTNCSIPDMSRHAMLLTPAEFAELVQDRRILNVAALRATRMQFYGVAVILMEH